MLELLPVPSLLLLLPSELPVGKMLQVAAMKGQQQVPFFCVTSAGCYCWVQVKWEVLLGL